MLSTDRYGRLWDLPAIELCPECGQPDNCGDCQHGPLSDADARLLGAVLPVSTLPNLQRTADALAAFDAAHGPQDPGTGSELAEAVGIAYGLDTADRNDPEVCADLIRPGAREPLGGEADLSFVRRMVKSWKGAS